MMERTKCVRLKWILRMGFCLALIAAIVMIGAVMVVAEDVKYSEGFTYSMSYYTILSGIGTCTDQHIILPPTTPKGDVLTHIGNNAFNYNSYPNSSQANACRNIVSIVIPDTVTYIGGGAFDWCSKLESVNIPAGVTSIEPYTFAECSSLTEIVLPAAVKKVGIGAFYNCNSLTDVYFCGTEAEWNAIEITEWRNAPLLNATIHFLGEAVETKLTGASLQLGQILAINYYATLNPAHTAAQIRFTYHGEITMVDGVFDEESGEYKFTFGRIPPQCMADEIKAELILIGEDGVETVLDVKETYSIREYCDDALVADPNNAVLATLLADILAYGDAAQGYTNYKKETPISTDFPVAPSECQDVTDTDFTLSEKTREDICFTSAGVRFAYVNRLYFKLKAADLTGVTVTVNGKAYTAEDLALVEDTADTYIFYTDSVYATEFDKVFTAELSVDGEVIQTLTYSVKSYVYAKQNGENAEMAALARALYAYGRSAIAYKQEQ